MVVRNSGIRSFHWYAFSANCGDLSIPSFDISGQRFFGEAADPEAIDDLIEHGAVERNLEAIQDDTQRDALSKFFELDPAKRWTAEEALQHDLLLTDNNTSTASFA